MTREDAIKRLKEGEPFSEIYNKEWEEAKQMAIEALQERKTGKWITEEIGIRSYATKCSVCRTILHKGHNFDNAQQYTEYVNRLGQYDKFCHECGAKMED